MIRTVGKCRSLAQRTPMSERRRVSCHRLVIASQRELMGESNRWQHTSPGRRVVRKLDGRHLTCGDSCGVQWCSLRPRRPRRG
jgi:hypothetical protein